MPALAIQTMHKARTAQPSRRGTPASQASSIQRYNNGTCNTQRYYSVPHAASARRPNTPAPNASRRALGASFRMPRDAPRTCACTGRRRQCGPWPSQGRAMCRCGRSGMPVSAGTRSGKAHVGKRKWESASGNVQWESGHPRAGQSPLR